MREFIRHPTDIPLEYQLEETSEYQREKLKDISVGGLCFQSSEAIVPGCGIGLTFPILDPLLAVKGTVVWCHKVGAHHEVGVMFMDVQTAFRVRMVEQVCHIQHYKKKVLHTEGRALSGEEAAMEWIEKHAAEFPAAVE